VPVQIIEAAERPSEPEEATLFDARNSIALGNPTKAAEYYSSLVKKGFRINELIKDLHDALYRFPIDVDLWQTLGDAHIRADELQDALNAYTKAEELLR
jgi:tetratricopeptide (TPR) repeat protein